jgi:hypothetical protein
MRLSAVRNLEDDRLLATELRDLGLKDAMAGLLAGAPLLEGVAGMRLGKSRLRRPAQDARRFLERGVGAPGAPPVVDHAELESILKRPLAHRFILPLSARAGRSELRDAKIAGRGSWHPVLASPDDLRTRAIANALEAGTVEKVRVCIECRRYYVSERRGRHRFCSSQCRDAHWNRETGAERTRRSRGQRAGSAKK